MVSVLLSCIPLQNQVGHSSQQGICGPLSEVCHQPSSVWVGETQNVIRLEKYLMASFCILWATVQILEDPWRTSISWIDSQVICERYGYFWMLRMKIFFPSGWLLFVVWCANIGLGSPKKWLKKLLCFSVFRQAFYIINSFLGRNFETLHNCKLGLPIQFLWQ